MESWLKRFINAAGASDSQGPLNKNAKIQSSVKYRQYKDSYALMEFNAPTLSHPRQCVFLWPYTVKQLHKVIAPAAIFDNKTCLSCS